MQTTASFDLYDYTVVKFKGVNSTEMEVYSLVFLRSPIMITTDFVDFKKALETISIVPVYLMFEKGYLARVKGNSLWRVCVVDSYRSCESVN